MKLLRIVSGDNQKTGFFSNEFSEAIEIPPDSRIALLNGAFNISAASIQVGSDATISYTVKDNQTPASTLTIPAQLYTQTAMLTALTQLLNYAMDSTVLNNESIAWVCDVDAGKMNINFAKTVVEEITLENTTKMDKGTDDADKTIYTATADTSGSLANSVFGSFGYSNNTCLTTDNTIALTPYRPADDPEADPPVATNDTRFIYGLLKSKPGSTKTTFDYTDFMYGVWNDNVEVHYIIDGVDVKQVAKATANPATGTTIRFSAGTVIFDDGQHTAPLGVYDDTGYHLGVGLRATNNSLQATQCYMNPFTTTSIQNGVIEKKSMPLLQMLFRDSSLGSTPASTKVSMQISENLRAALGFDDNPKPLSAIQGSFKGSIPLSDSATPTSLTVELPNLGGQILSYDGVSQKRRAIVAVIPSMLQQNQVLTYQPPYPAFIDLNNAYTLQLSKLEVRLLSSFDDDPVNLESPGCSLTFIIDSTNNHKSTTNNHK